MWTPPIDQCVTLWAINVLAIMGLWQTCQSGMIFERPADWLWNHLPKMACKPLFQCMACMSSVWGSAFFFSSPLRSLHILAWPVYVLTLCGALAVIQRFLDEPE